MGERSIKPTDAHRAFRGEVCALLERHGSNLSANEMLALASHLVGQIIALQDQRTMTPDLCMKIVSKNIEIGNREVFDDLAFKTEGSA